MLELKGTNNKRVDHAVAHFNINGAGKMRGGTETYYVVLKTARYENMLCGG